MRKHKATLLIGLALALAALSPASAMAKAGGSDRPLKGSGSAIATADVSTPTFEVTNEGSAKVTHLGKTTLSSDYTFTSGAGGTFTVAGTTEFVAANGDRLFTAFTGSGRATSATTSVARLHSTITGGTGRFEGASGSFTTRVLTETTSVVGTTVTATQTFTSHGHISY
jgi:hypothetical protein